MYLYKYLIYLSITINQALRSQNKTSALMRETDNSYFSSLNFNAFNSSADGMRTLQGVDKYGEKRQVTAIDILRVDLQYQEEHNASNIKSDQKILMHNEPGPFQNHNNRQDDEDIGQEEQQQQQEEQDEQRQEYYKYQQQLNKVRAWLTHKSINNAPEQTQEQISQKMDEFNTAPIQSHKERHIHCKKSSSLKQIQQKQLDNTFRKQQTQKLWQRLHRPMMAVKQEFMVRRNSPKQVIEISSDSTEQQMQENTQEESRKSVYEIAKTPESICKPIRPLSTKPREIDVDADESEYEGSQSDQYGDMLGRTNNRRYVLLRKETVEKYIKLNNQKRAVKAQNSDNGSEWRSIQNEINEGSQKNEKQHQKDQNKLINSNNNSSFKKILKANLCKLQQSKQKSQQYAQLSVNEVLQKKNSKKSQTNDNIGQGEESSINKRVISLRQKLNQQLEKKQNTHSNQQQSKSHYENIQEKQLKPLDFVVLVEIPPQTVSSDRYEANCLSMPYSGPRKTLLNTKFILQHRQHASSPLTTAFATRRTSSTGSRMDLGVRSLQEVVEQCLQTGVVSNQLYCQFCYSYTPESLKRFLNLFTHNSLQQWNFRANKITILDHRRLSELLCKLNPKRYKICTPLALDKQISGFLTSLYGLSIEEHQVMLNVVDGISRVDIWKSLEVRYRGLEDVVVKITEPSVRIEDIQKESPIKRDLSKNRELVGPQKRSRPRKS